MNYEFPHTLTSRGGPGRLMRLVSKSSVFLRAQRMTSTNTTHFLDESQRVRQVLCKRDDPVQTIVLKGESGNQYRAPRERVSGEGDSCSTRPCADITRQQYLARYLGLGLVDHIRASSLSTHPVCRGKQSSAQQTANEAPKGASTFLGRRPLCSHHSESDISFQIRMKDDQKTLTQS